MQIVEWYVELVRLTDSAGAGLNLAIAVGEPTARGWPGSARPRHRRRGVHAQS